MLLGQKIEYQAQLNVKLGPIGPKQDTTKVDPWCRSNVDVIIRRFDLEAQT